MVSQGINIKRWLLTGITVLSLLMPYLVYGFEFMYIDNKGNRQYSCGANRRGGYVKVKQIDKYQYRVYSKTINGVISFSPGASAHAWCSGFEGAARMACGLCPLPDEPTFQTEKMKT